MSSWGVGKGDGVGCDSGVGCGVKVWFIGIQWGVVCVGCGGRAQLISPDKDLICEI